MYYPYQEDIQMSERRSSNAAGRPQQRTGAPRPAGQRPAGQRRPNNNRRRARKRSNTKFIVFLVVIAVLAIVGGILVAGLIGGKDDPTTTQQGAQGNTPSQPTNEGSGQLTGVLADNGSDAEDDTTAVHAPALSGNYRVQVDDLHITEGLDSEWMNVLLLGSDQRTATEPFRTDSMIICSINKSTGEVKLTSLMRDTAMQMDGLGDESGLYRVNVACYVGGPEYLMQFLNDKLNLNIEYYVMVDFTSFSIIADQLGGIDIAVSMSEKDEINFNLHRQARVAYDKGMSEEEVYATHVYLEEYGENVHLNGPQVLAYARIRKLDSDSARTERQRKVLAAMLEKLRTRSPQEVMSLAMSLGGYVTTNMSIDEIISVALVVVSSDMQVEQHRIPENGTYVLETRDGESMLYDTNWESNAATVHQYIYGK